MTPDERGARRPEPGDRRPATLPGKSMDEGTERRVLDQAPSERYRRAAPAPSTAETGGSITRAVGFGAGPAVFGALVFVVFAGPFSFSAGLLVIALIVGRTVGQFVRAGAGTSVERGTRISAAVYLTLASLVGGNVGTWLFALSEGGVLGLPAYLGETFGLLVPTELVIGAATAWFSAR